MTNLHFCEVDEKLGLANINIIKQVERRLISKKFDELNIDDSYRFVKFFLQYIKISLRTVDKYICKYSRNFEILLKMLEI